jgi:transposase-like protein
LPRLAVFSVTVDCTTMDEGSYEARKSAPKDRVEITTRTERRRRWSAEEKLRIVRETLRPGAVAQVVADQYGISTGLLYTWRKQMLTAAMTGFAAVEVAPEAEMPPLLAAPIIAPEPADANAMDAAVEVALPDGTQVRVTNGATATLLADVFAALGRG